MPTTRAEPLETALEWCLDYMVGIRNRTQPPEAEPFFSERLAAYRALALAAADPAPAGAQPFRFLVESYDRRRREVAAMIEEADAAADDASAGPDALADALMEVAEGWCRSALSAAPATPLEPLDVERLAAAIHEYGGVCKSRYGHRLCGPSDHGIMAADIADAYAALRPTDTEPSGEGAAE